MKYYSEILDKNFDSVKELEKAEKEHADAEAKKAEAKALVKKESEVVNEAFAARNAARRAYNEKVLEARKTYNDSVKALREQYENSLKEVIEAKDKAEEEYSNKLAVFQKAHPEGYRLTLKDGDNVVTLTGYEKYETDMFDSFDRLLDTIRNFKLW